MITFASGSNTVQLPNPQYGDSLTHDNSVRYYFTMDKNVYSYKKDKKRTALLTFNNITQTQLDAFITFYINYGADDLDYTDVLGDTYDCHFMSEPFTAKSEIADLYSATIQLEIV